MKGSASNSTQMKWKEMCQLMREQKIDVLATQETHLDKDKVKELNKLFERQIHIIMSLDTNRPNVMGVAFIINKKLANWQEIKHCVLDPGRAIVIEIPWYNDKTLSCLNVYALNDPSKNKTFWNKIKSNWTA
ncbi:hypothetical protein J132_04023 [Termitomyces sp. J132]|nr:hypothetical protein J132_04023 [Termitomyces sp. J132]